MCFSRLDILPQNEILVRHTVVLFILYFFAGDQTRQKNFCTSSIIFSIIYIIILDDYNVTNQEIYILIILNIVFLSGGEKGE